MVSMKIYLKNNDNKIKNKIKRIIIIIQWQMQELIRYVKDALWYFNKSILSKWKKILRFDRY